MSPEPQTPAGGAPPGAPDYFPLAAGLIREYRRTAPEGEETVRFEVLSVAREGPVTRARCRTTRFGPDGRRAEEFTASKTPEGAYYGDTLELPLPPRVGARWTLPPDSYEVASLAAMAQVPAGRFEACLKVSCLIGGGDSGSGELLYAPGVGLVLEDRGDEASPYRLELTSWRRGEDA